MFGQKDKDVTLREGMQNMYGKHLRTDIELLDAANDDKNNLRDLKRNIEKIQKNLDDERAEIKEEKQEAKHEERLAEIELKDAKHEIEYTKTQVVLEHKKMECERAKYEHYRKTVQMENDKTIEVLESQISNLMSLLKKDGIDRGMSLEEVEKKCAEARESGVQDGHRQERDHQMRNGSFHDARS